MRASLKLAALSIVLLLTATGCPRQQHRFTSADVRGVNRSPEFAGSPGTALDDLTDGNASEGLVREVVEPDVVRRDGNTLYVLNQHRGLMLVDLDAQEILARVPTYGFPRDLYVRDSRAYVLVGQATGYVEVYGVAQFDVNARLYVVDVSVPEDAHVLAQFDLEGDLVDSRLVGDVLYAVGGEYQWQVVPGEGTGAVGVDETTERPMPAVRKAATGTSWVTSVDVSDPADIHQADQLSFDGQGTVIQATSSAIFVAAPDWQSGDSAITHVDIQDPAGDMAVRGSVTVKGQIADRFKMDAYDGVLRVVSASWSGERRVNLTTVSLADPDNLQILAERDFETAHGDTLFATRFDGERGYVVTYFQVDPLYVLDLSDPTDPHVAGELEVPGWSTHIEPMGDRLLALGVDDTDGRRVSVSLFNVADPAAPSLVERVSFGDNWSWSSAYSDVKAFAVFDGVAVVPFSGWNGDNGGYDRLQFVTFTPDDLAVRGHVDLNGSVLRTLDYNSLYYGLTLEELATIDASDLDAPQVVHRLALAENVVDFAELSSGVGAEIVARADGTSVVHTLDAAGEVLGTAEASVGNLAETLAYGTTVVLVGTQWDNSSHYTVALVDCSDPAEPVLDATVKVEIDPYFWWDYPVVYVDGAVPGRPGAPMMDIMPFWWWGIPWQPQKSVFLMGDTLVLRGHADSYDAVVGNADPMQGVALLDLTDTDSASTVGFGFVDIVSVDPVGSKVIVGTRQDAGMEQLQPVCSYFVTEVDLLASPPSAGPTVNVPGTFVQYDASTDVLTLLDDQWSDLLGLTRSLRTVRWTGSASVTPLDEAELPAMAVNVLGRGDRVYLDAYADSGLELYAATVSNDGALALGDAVPVDSGWGSLVDARGDSAFVQSNGHIVARYAFTGNAGELADQVDVMAPPLRIRFGESQAYLVLGYSGVTPMAY